MRYESRRTILIVFFILLFLNFGAPFSYAQSSPLDATTTAELQSKIDDRNVQIKQLENEITQYNLQVDNVSKQGVTLQNTLKTLDLTKKKINTDINLTQNKIVKTQLTIQQLTDEIDKTNAYIETNKKAIMTALRNVEQLEDMGIVQLLLSKKSMSDVLGDWDNIRQVQQSIKDKSTELTQLNADMAAKQSSYKGQKTTLLNLKQDLTGKKQIVLQTAQEKAVLLAQTKNQEANFKAIVKTKEQQKAQFEQEIYDFESKLNIAIDKSQYPVPSNGILSWPLEVAPTRLPCDPNHKIVSCIVRGFSHPTVRNGVVINPGHNGVDFRAVVGTRVSSVLDGVVAGTGNTDIYRGCYGLGKWVMVNHPDGLSSIYMHLSVISVAVGQRLSAGDLVGYSGNTGSSEAPHLHVTVYATQGVKIQQFTNSIGCKLAVVPLADPKAYLDPMGYFPSL